MAEIELQSINKYYGKTHVIKDFSLKKRSVFYNTRWSIWLWKINTLKNDSWSRETNSGSILINNKSVNDLPPRDRGIAMVFQSYALYPHMTVFENMAFGLKIEKEIKG